MVFTTNNEVRVENAKLQRGCRIYDDLNRQERIYIKKDNQITSSDLHIVKNPHNGGKRRIERQDIWRLKKISNLNTKDKIHRKEARKVKDELILEAKIKDEDGISIKETKIFTITENTNGYIVLNSWLQGRKDTAQFMFLEETDLKQAIIDISQNMQIEEDKVEDWVKQEYTDEMVAGIL
jgi:pyoverdine/dityrosine biosynthesis protein Dit1